jgi:hypothetical protein
VRFMFRRSVTVVLAGMLTATAAVSAGAPVQADHSWGGYHWARTANPFTVRVGDNVNSTWDPYLALAVTDWSTSAVLSLSSVPGVTSPKTCKASAATVQVCNAAYGRTGWLGVAQVWVSGSHITQGTVKLNDTYFASGTYNTPAWRNLVMCQEIGHTLGLDHQDENFSNANLNSCMDYTNLPESNQRANVHDFEQLALIYTHIDSTNTTTSSATTKGAVGTQSSEWGRLVKGSAHQRGVSTFVQDLGSDRHVFTFVIWAA